MGKRRLKVIADRGYYSGPQIKACADAGIATILPKNLTSGARAHGRFDRADFIYIAQDDEYLCPAGQRAIYRFTREEHGMQLHRYWSSACRHCDIKSQCTPSDYRRITRWEHESVLEAAQNRLDRMPDAMTVRGRTVEHVFGTFKHWMGYTHFLTRRVTNVSTVNEPACSGVQPQARYSDIGILANHQGNEAGEWVRPLSRPTHVGKRLALR
ncbi:hypothetical protein QFZ89_007798 [Paraburkholderia youngii]